MKILRFTIFMLVILYCWAPSALAEDTPLDMYTNAMKESRAGNSEKSIEILWKIVNENPEHHIADDALFQIGTISEKRLGDYETAQKAYQQVFEQFPSSKNARRSKKRHVFLKKARETGDKPLRVFNKIMQQYPKLGSEKALAMMTDLYEKYPGFNRRDQVIYWIAEEYRRQGDYKKAILKYEELLKQFPKSKWSYFSIEKMGQVELEMRNFERAKDIFKKLADFEDTHPGAATASQQLISIAVRYQVLLYLFYLSLLIAIGFFSLWIIKTKWKEIGKKQIIAAVIDFVLINAVVFVAIGYAISKPIIFLHSLLVLLVALSAATVCNSLYINTNKFGAFARYLLSMALVFAVVAIVYAVYYKMGIINLLYDSIVYNLTR